MKKVKELKKNNEGKQYKNKMTNDKAAKIITKEINSRARNQLEIIFKKIV